jgi:hypothetical protein
MATTVAIALWHGPDPTRSAFRGAGLRAGAVDFHRHQRVIGLLPLSPLDANAFTNYLSHYSGLRVAKGFRGRYSNRADALDGARPRHAFICSRMWLGLAGVIAVGVAERASFASLVNLTVPYRITATFSTMHTGGSEIELPRDRDSLVWLAFSKEWPTAVRLAGLILLALART